MNKSEQTPSSNHAAQKTAALLALHQAIFAERRANAIALLRDQINARARAACGSLAGRPAVPLSAFPGKPKVF